MDVNVWDRLLEWVVAAMVASLTLVSGIIVPESIPNGAPTSEGSPTGAMMGWAQQMEQPPIEQVGEGSGEDVETLDEGAPPAEDTSAVDPATLDAGAPAAAPDEDVELLDQGAPPAPSGEPVETVAVAPAVDTSATYVAPVHEPAAAAGPVLPPGFGTGRVHAIAGRGEAPIGIADCHVGAVTGRAYVGIDCGDDGETSFVGHAPSFESFPFVLEADFPFEGDEAFFTDPNFPFGGDEELAVAANRDDGAETDVFVSSRGGDRDRNDDVSEAPVIETGRESAVSFAQRARDREPRVRVENRSRRVDNGKKRARAEAESRGTDAETRQRDRDDSSQNDGPKSESKKKKFKDKGSKEGTSNKDRAGQKENNRARNR